MEPIKKEVLCEKNTLSLYIQLFKFAHGREPTSNEKLDFLYRRSKNESR